MSGRTEIDRRRWLRLAASAIAAGVTVPSWARAAGAKRAPRTTAPRTTAGPGRAKSCILLYMEGGPSQLDTFDPKPGRPTGGPFGAIETSVSGLRFSQHLPGLARRAKRLAVIRSLTSKEGNHDRARHLMHTGYPPQGGVAHPALGSLLAEARGRHELPGYVSIGGPGAGAGLLGAGYSPLPVLNPAKPTRNLALARGVDEARLETRAALWRAQQADFAASRPGEVADGGREIGEQALALMRARGAAAFDLAAEPEAVRQSYGDTPFGSGCLMARRLVAEGVAFVEVMLKGWDTHEDNFRRVTELSVTLDRAMGALLDDLGARGLLESTLVLWMGDFGRTPLINPRGGRDHFPAASAVVLAGGGVKPGEVVGATSADGDEIVSRPVTVPDLFRTVAAALALDADKTRFAPSGRPIKTVDGGKVISELL